MDKKKATNKLIALFLLSVVEIAYELYVMRIFSVGNWTNFGSMVISTALLGMGIAGIILTLSIDWIKQRAEQILSWSAIITPIALVFCTILAQLIPFNPVFLGADSRQVWFIAGYYILYGVPFFIVAVFIGVLFIVMSDRIKALYFSNMVGSGIGGIFIILFMFVLPVKFLLLPILFLAILASFLVTAEQDSDSGKKGFRVHYLIGMAISTALALTALFMWSDIRVSDYKAISYVRKYPDSKLVHYSFGPEGEYHVYASRYFHFAPGLSDNVALKLEKMPSQPFWGMYNDGNGPIGVMGMLEEDEKEYLDYLPMAAPYMILEKPSVLLINLSGGTNTQVALHNKAKKIDIVEPSESMIHILRDDPNIKQFTGDVLSNRIINLTKGNPRAFAIAHRGEYNLIEISLVDSIGLSDAGGYPIHEDYTYTVEAFKDYLGALNDKGIISITLWDRLNPPRNVLRVLNSIITALREEGYEEPGKHLFSYGLFRSTTSILIKKTPFTEGELYDLSKFCDSRSFELIYTPVKKLDAIPLDKIIQKYNAHFENKKNKQVEIASQKTETKQEESYTNLDAYRSAIPVMLAGKAKTIEENYIFDIRPPRDERPYYAGYLKLGRLGDYLDQLPDVAEEWGYLLFLAVFLQSLIFGIIIIALPVAVKWKTLFKNRKGTIPVILYYASLGAGYMLVEIFLIQRLGVFLANTTYATSIVITAMLISSALGNLASMGLSKYRRYIVPASAILIAAALIFYIFGLNSLLYPHRSDSMLIRVLISLAVIIPPAFFMGVPYPNGLDSLQKNRPNLLPWAWGMNGGFSVTGATLARIISVASGFKLLLATSIVLYLIAGITYSVNENSGEIPQDKENSQQQDDTVLA
ncbi:hypothetical protein WKV44_07205 [Spirochaetia bacterium 38H-sp]|uniref:Spermidine synthase n=1 Tax=Rarispira pelagica TaxID=3141764 RepID=A0ABU9UCD6_9SPIR